MNQDNTQAADELEVFLTARQTGEELPVPPGLSAEEAALVDALLRLAEETQPDPSFAAELEAQLRAKVAANLASPKTAPAHPGLWHRWSDRLRAAFPPLHRARWATLAAVALVLAMLLAVPPVRAAVLSILRIGAVRIFLAEPTPRAVTTAAVPTPTPLGPTLDLAGETTLAEAQRKAGFPVRLPSYPADLGAPDRVYLQDLGGQAVILIWIDQAHPSRVRFSLHELGPGIDVTKNQPLAIEQTTVRSQPAVWTSGPYMLEVQPSTQAEHRFAARRLVTGHTLVWAEGAITYRLETDRPLDEALRIAESLR